MRVGRRLQRFRIAALALLFSTHGALAQTLTPEVRAKIFAPTADVRLAKRTVRLALTRTDSRGYYKCPYLTVFVNGKGPFTFLYDTGAAYTVVSSKIVRAASTPVMFDRHGQRDVVLLSRLLVGGVALASIWAIHDDGNPGIDGILGAPAFGTASVLFDLAARELRVSRSRIDLPGSFELPYESPFNVPTVPVNIGSRKVPILIDTGDDAYGLELRPEELGNAAVEHPLVAAASVLNGTNVQATKTTIMADPISLGPTRSDHAVVAVNADLPVGDLGYDVLRQFRFVIDPQAKVVRFQPRFAGSRFAVPPTLSAGFTLKFSGNGLVKGVSSGGEAQRQGLLPGDLLLSINGVPAKSLTPRVWDHLLARGGELSVRWMHSDRTRSGHWKVRPLN